MQIAANMVPLVLAVAFARTATRFVTPDFRTADVITAWIHPSGRPDTTLLSLADALARSGGVESIAAAEWPPLYMENVTRLTLPGGTAEARPVSVAVSPAYFQVLDIPLLAGRLFDRRDAVGAAGPRPVVVSAQFVRRFFPTGHALGTVLRTVPRSRGEPAGSLQIVGIVADRLTGRATSSSALTDGSMIYEPIDPSSQDGVLLARTAGDAEAMTAAVRDTLRGLTGQGPRVETLASVLADRVVSVRKIHLLLLVLGIVALLLAIVGVVGVVSFHAQQRWKEYAIRQALGASPWAVRVGVVRSSLMPVPIGLAVGLLASWGALRLAEGTLPLLEGAQQPAPYVAVTAVLLVAAVAVLAVAAYPAGGRDPLVSLRDE
jgi:ABC-type antimicrobial peptide transport system permease subunit